MTSIRAWAVLRWLFGAFFAATGVVIIAAQFAGVAHGPPQPTAAAQAFTDALDATGFIDPVLGLVYLAGGVALIIRRTIPLGVVMLAPVVTVILLHNTLLAHNAVWGIGWGLALAALAYRHRAGLAPLWNYRDQPRPRYPGTP